MKDQYGREIDYLRISVTDRCNMRCLYCMPEEGISEFSHRELLTYEQIVMIARCMSRIGIRKVKLTGGEPLVRKDLSSLVRMLKKIPMMEEVTLTTNGTLLSGQAEQLKAAGLDGVNISLDSLDERHYEQLTRGGRLEDALRGIRAAVSAGFASVKVNCLMIRGENEEEAVSMAGLAKQYPVDVRFIEMMPIGCGKEFTPVWEESVRSRLVEAYGELAPCQEKRGNGPAVYYALDGFLGKVGFISAVSRGFCDSCNRVRLTADGQLKLCLQYRGVLDVGELIRCRTKEEQLTEMLRMAIFLKPKKHEFLKKTVRNHTGDTDDMDVRLEKRRMSQIGG